MDRILTSFGFTKCYIDDIIIFNLTLGDNMHHLQELFGRLKKHKFKLHLNKCWFFHNHVEYLGHMIYLGGLGV